MKKGKKNLTCVFQLHIKTRMKQSLLGLTHGISTTCLTFVNFVSQELEVGKVETVPLLNYAQQCKHQTTPNKNTQRTGAATP